MIPEGNPRNNLCNIGVLFLVANCHANSLCKRAAEAVASEGSLIGTTINRFLVFIVLRVRFVAFFWHMFVVGKHTLQK